MAAGKYNDTIEQGETYIRVFTWKDSTDTAINLTGYTARMQLRAENRLDAAAFSFNESSGLTLGGTAGTITLTIAATSTATMDGRYFYDLELISGSGIVTKLLKGILTVAGEVTR